MKTYYYRNLPHWHPAGATIFITWRLSGSLPQSAIARLEATRQLLQREITRTNETPEERHVRHSKKLFAVLDEILDKADSGPLWLRQEPIAAVVEEAMLNRYSKLYTLWAYVVMANHIHIFLRPKVAQTSVCDAVAQTSVCDAVAQTSVCDAEPIYVPLQTITKSLKGFTAREANRLLNRTGQPFWQDESFDHWARDEVEFYRIIAYIENNPVKAGLVAKPEDWKWSSAHERWRRGWTEIRPLT